MGEKFDSSSTRAGLLAWLISLAGEPLATPLHSGDQGALIVDPEQRHTPRDNTPVAVPGNRYA